MVRLGYTVRLIAPQFVKPYVKCNKNDANDAEAICEAVSRMHMRFVPAKSVEQQYVQCLHRVRSRLVRARTRLANQVRGLLMEYGIVLPQQIHHLRHSLPAVLESEGNELTPFTRWLFASPHEEVVELGKNLIIIEPQVRAALQGSESSQRIGALANGSVR